MTLSFLTVALIVTAVCRLTAGQTCNPVPNSQCACKMSDGSGVMDMSPLADNELLSRQGFKEPSDDYHTYFFNPCKAIEGLGGDCAASKNTASCQQGGTGKAVEYYRLGQQGPVSYTYIPGADPFQVRIKYTGGTATDEGGTRSVVVTAVCDPNQELFVSYDGETGSTYDEILFAMKIQSRSICLNAGSSNNSSCSSSGGLSIGSVLCIVFFCLLSVYVAAGMA